MSTEEIAADGLRGRPTRPDTTPTTVRESGREEGAGSPEGRMAQALTAFVGWAASVFQRVEVRGGPLPDGPVLATANHQNALLDPLVIFRVAGRPTRPLAKAPLFDQLLLGTVLRGLGGLPVYRRQDDPSQMHRNEDTFRAAIDALLEGHALQIYPEGRSHSEPSMVPLRTGAARIALAAEKVAMERAEKTGMDERAGMDERVGMDEKTAMDEKTMEQKRSGEQGIRIVPVGLTWERKHLFGGRVLVEIGEGFPVRPWLTEDGAEDAEAVRALTDEIARRLREVTLNLPSVEDRELVAAADRIYTRQREIHGYRERDSLSRRVPRLRRFAEALEWLREEDPRRYRRLSGRVRRHDRVARLLGVEEGEVPSRYRAGAVMRYAVGEGAALLLGLPLAAVGTVIWYPAWVAPRWVVRRVQPELESVATYKLATGFLTVPLTLVGISTVTFLLWGTIGAAATALTVPILGLLALGWRDRWARVREDATLFFKVLGRPRLRSLLARRRADLAAEFDRVVGDMGRDMGRGAPDGLQEP